MIIRDLNLLKETLNDAQKMAALNCPTEKLVKKKQQAFLNYIMCKDDRKEKFKKEYERLENIYTYKRCNELNLNFYAEFYSPKQNEYVLEGKKS